MTPSRLKSHHKNSFFPFATAGSTMVPYPSPWTLHTLTFSTSAYLNVSIFIFLNSYIYAHSRVSWHWTQR